MARRAVAERWPALRTWQVARALTKLGHVDDPLLGHWGRHLAAGPSQWPSPRPWAEDGHAAHLLAPFAAADFRPDGLDAVVRHVLSLPSVQQVPF